MSEQGIQIPEGTIVNGQPFKKYKELQKRIAELEAELKPQVDAEKNTRRFKVGDDVVIQADTTAHNFPIGSEQRIQGFYGAAYKIGGLVVPDEDLKFVDWSLPPSVPSWIAPGKWVENTVNNCVLKVKSIDDEWITFFPHQGESANRVAPICYVSNYKPFTPPPCPELPKGWSMRLIDKLKEEIDDWREKWGTV